MNVNLRTPADTGDERLEKFLAIFPEQAVHDFVNSLLSAELMDTSHSRMLTAYDEARRNEEFYTFSEPEIQWRYEEFDSAFDALNLFRIKHFFVPNEDVNVTELYPDQKNTKDEGDRKMREWRAAELKALSLGFRFTYEKFVKAAMSKLNG